MSYARDLLTGIAQMISDSSIALFRPNGVYSAAENGIVFGGWPQSPDRCVVLNYTPVRLGTEVSMEKGLLEAHIRGGFFNPSSATDTATAVRDLLHNTRNKPLGTANIIQLLHNNSVPLVQDGNRRYEHVEVFTIDLDTPATANRTAAGWD